MRYCPKCAKMESRSECAYGPSYWDKYAKPVKQEDAPAMGVGGGQVAGLGVSNPNLPNQAEPGVNKKKKIDSFVSFMRRKNP